LKLFSAGDPFIKVRRLNKINFDDIQLSRTFIKSITLEQNL